jgi:translation elongation factor Ts
MSLITPGGDLTSTVRFTTERYRWHATQITAKDVAELRARTGAGMMDCKKALEEADGDMDAAIDILRKKGIAKADKRADRAASEGQIVTWTSPDGSVAAMIEVNCETDFVGRNDEFGALAKQLAEHVGQDDASTASWPSGRRRLPRHAVVRRQGARRSATS